MCLIWISWLCPACQVACGRGFNAQCQLHCEACCADPEIKNFFAGLTLTYCRASLLICFYTAAFIQLCQVSQVLHSNSHESTRLKSLKQKAAFTKDSSSAPWLRSATLVGSPAPRASLPRQECSEATCHQSYRSFPTGKARHSASLK